MRTKIIFYFALVIILQSCTSLKDIINDRQYTSTNDNVNYNVSNTFYVQGIGNTSHLNLKEDKLREKLKTLGYELKNVQYGKDAYKDEYIKMFSMSKLSLSTVEIEQECRKAIRWSIRGMPAPTIYFDDVYTAISKCEKCCKEELESSYYQKVTNGIMKRDIYLKFFPNGKYSDRVKKELIAIKNGANIKDGEIDPLGDLQKTVDIAGKVYDNSVVGQTIKEIGKNLPKSDNLSNQNNSNYEILEQSNIDELKISDENARVSSTISISVGCHNYKHSLDKENEGFSITYFSENRISDKGFTLNKDLSFFKDEIDTKTIYQDGGIATISFVADNGKTSFLKIKFKKGGSYRLEVHGKNY